MANIKDSEASARGFAENWDKEVRKLWPAAYPESLSNKLKKLNVSTILDCAGGTGYPSIELKNMGWNITYSDGWDTMLHFFKQRIDKAELDIPIYKSRWETLTQVVPNTYDALMCVGNSFVGINAYDTEYSIDGADANQQMRIALREFYNMLNDGGVLYIDLFTKKHSAPEQPYSQSQTTDTHHIFTTISYDPVRNVRTNLTTSTSLIDGSEQDVIAKVTPMFAEELIALLQEAGFSRIERSPVDDADYVDSFFAFKD